MPDGWDAIDGIGRQDEPLPDPHQPGSIDLVDKLYVDVFNNPPGLKLLALWKRQFLDQPVCVPGAGAEVGFHREGQNSVVRECITRLHRGLTPKT